MKHWLALIFALLLAACSEEAVQDAVGADASAGIVRTTEEGPVKVTVTLSPESPQLGDSLTLALEVRAKPDVAVEMPAFGEALGRFSIVDFTPRQQIDPDGSQTHSQTYTLQAPMSGRQRIPPLRIEYLDRRGETTDADTNPSADSDYRELLSEELAVDIASVLPEGAVINELRGPRAPLEEIPTGFWQRHGWLLVILVAVLIGGWWGIAWWQKRQAEHARKTAFDRALERLATLEQQDLPTGEAVDGWYVELSDIVRRYIEDQYGLRAPELTSEEFLQEARRSEALSSAQRELLPLFLEQCDRVKYAAYSPQQDESQEALALARRFFGERPVDPAQAPAMEAA